MRPPQGMIGEWGLTINPGVQTMQEEVSVDLCPMLVVVGMAHALRSVLVNAARMTMKKAF